MVRPTKERRVENIPEVKFFKPAGVPARNLREVLLTMEEVESIRLKDREGLTQKEASERMEVSRPTFQRILTKARNKIAEALIEGKAIRFQGGDYKLAKFSCRSCGRDFIPTMGRGRNGRNHGRGHQTICPDCMD